MGVSKLRLFPLNTVLFPGAALNLHVFEPRYKQMISECLDGGEAFGVCLIRKGEEAGDASVDPYEVGTTAEIGDVMPLPQGRFYINAVGKRRFRIHSVVSRDPYLLCEVEYIDDDPGADAGAVAAISSEIRSDFREYQRLLVAYSGKDVDVDLPADPLEASFAIGNALQIADSVKQRLLETRNLEERLRVEQEFLRRLLPQLRALLDRKAPQTVSERNDPPGGTFRAQQERYFGKSFSLN